MNNTLPREHVLKMIKRHTHYAEYYVNEYNAALAEGDHDEASYLIGRYYAHKDALAELIKRAA